MNLEQFKTTESRHLQQLEDLIEQSIGLNPAIDSETQTDILNLLRRMMQAEQEFLEESPGDYHELYVRED